MQYSLETVIYFEKSCSIALHTVLFCNVPLTRVMHSVNTVGHFFQKIRHCFGIQHLNRCSSTLNKSALVNQFLGALFFSVWGTFPCYLLHFGAETCTLLNFGARICHVHCSSIFSMILLDFSTAFIDLPKVSIDYSIVFSEFYMVTTDFSMCSIDFSLHNMHMVNMQNIG